MLETRIQAVHDSLVRTGRIVPVALGGAEERAWLDCDLASLAENRLGEVQDPRCLDDAHRVDWIARATDEPADSLKSRSRFERCYWIIEGDERVGTMALSTGTLGGNCVRLSSLYIFQSCRHRGVGRRVLHDLMSTAASQRLALRLSTSWCWQRTVKFYLKLGMWVYMWKRDLDLFWDKSTPPALIEVNEETASLCVQLEDSIVTLARAHRHGDTLELESLPEPDDKRLGHASWHALSTFSLGLALAGWPLIRSDTQWKECYHADGGPPEALAYKITIWEAWERKHNRIVETPRIAGLEYPTWDEYEVRWEALNREFWEKQKQE